MTYLHKTTDFFRGEAIGFTYVFDTDIEVSEDLSGEIVDYSGCGYKTAKRLLKEAKALINN